MPLIDVLGPIFALVSIGYFCGKKSILNHNQIEGFEIFLFKIAIPCYLFNSTINHKLSELLNLTYIVCYLLAFVVVATISCGYFLKKEHTATIATKMLMSGYVNAAFYGVPILTFMVGNAKAAVLSNILQVVILNPAFVTFLGLIKHKHLSIYRRIFSTILNPIVLMPSVGMLINYFDISIPNLLILITKTLGSGASSLALFAFGLSISTILVSKKNLNKDLWFTVFSKGILHPLVAFILGKYVFHLEEYWLRSIVIMTSGPPAFIIYLIAKQFHTESETVKVIIAISSFVSLLSLIVISLLIPTVI
jgi:predicted permease